MTTDEDIMKEMLERSTNPAKDKPDEMGVQMFYMLVRSNPKMVHKAQEMIITKIRSQNVNESIKAIALLEECMAECGPEFQDEIAKFRFLNDFIRLVCRDHEGATTPVAVKKRIMECLLLWTTQFPHKSKIREVYDKLSKEGDVVDHGSSDVQVAIPKRESILGKDETVLAELIRSKDPENYKRANLLIQHRVSQHARRNELLAQHKSELQEVQTTIEILDQMLDTYEAEGDSQVGDASNETMNVIRELYMSCKRHKPMLQNMPEVIGNADETLIADTLEANDMLQAVMKRYKSVVVHSRAKIDASAASTDATASHDRSGKSNADLLSDLLGDIVLQPKSASATSNGVDLLQASSTLTATKPTSTATNSPTTNTLGELDEILASPSVEQASSQSPGKDLRGIFGKLDLLEPIPVAPAPVAEETKREADGTTASQRRGYKDLHDIDVLSEQLFRQNLSATERIGSFKKEPEKVTLNDLKVKDRLPNQSNVASTPATPKSVLGGSGDAANDLLRSEVLKDDVDELDVVTVSREANDDAMLTTEAINAAGDEEATKNDTLPVKHLSEISIDLDEVTPMTEERVLMDDDDMKIMLNFTEDRPSRQVSVIVVTVVNKSKMPVKDFQFEASVKKPSKVRLLSPTDTGMPAFKPFRPPTPINQVMLLLNPTGKAVDVTCIVGYKLGDDPDPVKESIVAKDIPYVE